MHSESYVRTEAFNATKIIYAEEGKGERENEMDTWSVDGERKWAKWPGIKNILDMKDEKVNLNAK